MNSDIIFVIENGTVCEQGNHEVLMSKKCVYYNYVNKQKIEGKNEKQKEMSIDEIEDFMESQNSPVNIGNSRNLDKSLGLIVYDHKDEIEKDLEPEKKVKLSVPWGKLWADIVPYKWAALLGMLACLGQGAEHPLLGFFIADLIQVLANLRDGKDGARSE